MTPDTLGEWGWLIHSLWLLTVVGSGGWVVHSLWLLTVFGSGVWVIHSPQLLTVLAILPCQCYSWSDHKKEKWFVAALQTGNVFWTNQTSTKHFRPQSWDSLLVTIELKSKTLPTDYTTHLSSYASQQRNKKHHKAAFLQRQKTDNTVCLEFYTSYSIIWFVRGKRY